MKISLVSVYFLVLPFEPVLVDLDRFGRYIIIFEKSVDFDLVKATVRKKYPNFELCVYQYLPNGVGVFAH